MRVGISETTFIDPNGICYVKSPIGKLEPHSLITKLFEELPEDSFSERIIVYDSKKGLAVLPAHRMDSILGSVLIGRNGRLYVDKGGNYEPRGSSLSYNAILNKDLEFEAYQQLNRNENIHTPSFALSQSDKQRLSKERGLESKLKE